MNDVTYLTGTSVCSSMHRVCRSCATWHTVARHWQGFPPGGSTVQFLIGRLCATRNSAPYTVSTPKRKFAIPIHISETLYTFIIHERAVLNVTEFMLKLLVDLLADPYIRISTDFSVCDLRTLEFELKHKNREIPSSISTQITLFQII